MRGCLVSLAVFLLVFGSCEQASSRAPFALVGCSVEEGRLEELPRSIRIDFNDEVEFASAVANLVLAEDGVPLYCTIRVEEQSIIVSPWRALGSSSSFRLAISENLRSLEGQCLALPFSRSFSLLDPGRTSLEMDRFVPPSATDQALVLGFSAPVDEFSARAAISLDPDWPHRLKLEEREDGGSLCRLEAIGPWPQGLAFTLRIDRSLRSREGALLDRDEYHAFSLEELRARLLSLEIRDSGGSLIHDSGLDPALMPQRVDAVPMNFTIHLTWDRPFLLRNLDGVLFLGDRPLQREGASYAPLFLEAEAGQLVPVNEPDWGAVLPLWVASGGALGAKGDLEDGEEGLGGSQVLAWLSFDNPFCEPPRVEGLRYLLFDDQNRPEASLLGSENAFDAFAPPIQWYPLDVARPFAVEFFVFCSPGQEIDPVWFVEHVECRFDSMAFTLLLDSVRFDSFTLGEAPPGFEGLWRCEFSGSLTNRNGRGLASFEVPAGMPDRAGRRSRDRYLVTLCK